MAAISLRLRARAMRPASAAWWVSPTEMDVFEEQIGGEQKVVGRPAGAVNGAIVADAENDRRTRGEPAPSRAGER